MQKPFSQDWVLTQGFGQNPDAYKQFGLLGHDGLDYGLPTGTEVLAPHDGTIIEATNDPTGYGNYLKIENSKEGSVLAHLADFTVNVGDTVTAGQLVAHSDNTGNSTGPHLHWGYYAFPRDRSNGYAGFIDQSSLLTSGGTTVTQSVLEKDLQECLTQHDALVTLSNQKSQTIDQLSKANNDKQAQIDSLTQDKSGLEKEVSDLGASNTALKTNISAVQKQNTDLLSKMADMAKADSTAIDEGLVVEQKYKDLLKQQAEQQIQQANTLEQWWNITLNTFWRKRGV